MTNRFDKTDISYGDGITGYEMCVTPLPAWTNWCVHQYGEEAVRRVIGSLGNRANAINLHDIDVWRDLHDSRPKDAPLP